MRCETCESKLWKMKDVFRISSMTDPLLFNPKCLVPSLQFSTGPSKLFESQENVRYAASWRVCTGVSISLLFVDLCVQFCVQVFDTGGVTICLRTYETKFLVRSRCWLEDGGGLQTHWVIYKHHQASVVPMGTWLMGDPGILWVVRIPSHITVCLIDSPLEQGRSLIFLISNKIKTHERLN